MTKSANIVLTCALSEQLHQLLSALSCTKFVCMYVCILTMYITGLFIAMYVGTYVGENNLQLVGFV